MNLWETCLRSSKEENGGKGGREKEGGNLKRRRSLLEEMQCSKLVVVAVQFYNYHKSHRIAQLKWVNCMAHELYLNKAVCKKNKDSLIHGQLTDNKGAKNINGAV